MHISEGVLSGPVLISGVALAAVGTTIGLKKIDYDHIAHVGMLSASFFVASLIHVPIGPSNVHLIMNGILGLLLGWAAFPAILVALILQGVFFQFGGITTIGINTFIMATPAVIGYYLFGSMIQKNQVMGHLAAFGCGFTSVFVGAIFVGLALIFTQKNFLEAATLVVIAYIPVMIIEGLMTTFCVTFLKKVQPDLISSMKKDTLSRF
jgi:cobalt/nickel transport system permease protein